MYEQIRSNQIKSTFLIVGMAILLLVMGFVIGEAVAPGAGPVGLGVALVIWLVMMSVSYWGGDKMMLAMSSAKPIEKRDHQQLFNVVEEVSIAAGLPMPKVYLIEDSAPNAFATGRSPETAAVAITRGLLDKLSRDELQGVMAHEMSHVQNRDIVFMTMAGIMLGVIVLLADFYLRHFRWTGPRTRRSGGRDKGGVQAIMIVIAIVLAILAPIIARILYFALSRRREYLADASAAELTRYPEGLASALEKIANDKEVLEVANRATAPMYIVNPIKPFEARARAFSGLTATHPPIQQRIEILRSMAGGPSLGAYQTAWRQIGGFRYKTLMSEKTIKQGVRKADLPGPVAR